MAPPLPESVQRYAAARYGIVPRRVLTRAELSAKQVRGRVRAGLLAQVHRGVFRVCSTPRSWEQRILAACLATGGVASHRSAERLWDPRPPDIDEYGCAVEVTVPRSSAPRPEWVIVHRAQLDPHSCTHRHHIPVTTPMRMLLDLAAVTTEDEVAAALERSVTSGLLSIASVRNELDRTGTRGRSGIGTMRRILSDWPLDERARPDSPLEVAFARLCQRAGLPAPVHQHRLVLNGRPRSIDFAYPERMAAIELDGFEAHSGREAFQDDRARQNDLIRAGWQVLRFTGHDVHKQPDHVVNTINGLLTEPLPTSTQPA